MESRLTDSDRERITEFADAAKYERDPDMLVGDGDGDGDEPAASD